MYTSYNEKKIVPKKIHENIGKFGHKCLNSCIQGVIIILGELSLYTSIYKIKRRGKTQ